MKKNQKPKPKKTSQKGEIQYHDFTGEFYSTFKELIQILSNLKKKKRKKCFQIHLL